MPSASEAAKVQIKKVPAEALRFAAGNCEFAEPTGETKNVPVSIVARTGQPISHWYWGKVIHDMEGLRLHKKSLPIDYAHYDVEVLGFLDRFETQTGDLVVGGELVPFTPEDRATEVIHKARNQVPYEASIYFSGPLRLEEIEQGATAEVNGYTVEGPAVIFREWSLRGVAICPYGYDRNTNTKLKAGDAGEQGEVPVEFCSKEKTAMPDPTKPTDQLTEQKPDGELAQPESKPESKPEEKPAGELAQPESKPESKPEEKPAGELAQPEAKPDEARAEVRRFIDAFGPEGATWFAEGKTFEQAQQAHSEKLAAENNELREKLQAADLGEEAPLSFADADAGGKGGEHAKNYGEGLSALVAQNAACLGGKPKS